LNVKERDVIKALDNLPLYLIDCCCATCHMEMELGHTLILFNEVELAVIFGIKIT
jgi:hypothetical protein